MAVLGSLSLIVRTVSVDVKQHSTGTGRQDFIRTAPSRIELGATTAPGCPLLRKSHRLQESGWYLCVCVCGGGGVVVVVVVVVVAI